MTHKLATVGKNRGWFSILVSSARWEVARLSLVWAGFALATWLTYLVLFTLVHWFARLLLRGVDRNIAIFLATLATLFLLHSIYDWSQRMVDNLFFPDTADFKEKVETLCQNLAEINQREELKHFLINRIPSNLRVTEVFLHEQPQPAPVNAITLPLEMGRHSLGFLTIGPRRSGRSFGYMERLVLTQLQEQISLVLSGIQLTEARETAERTGQLKVNFLTNLSHQLRTPLNTVINSTGLVADGALGETTETQAEYLQRAVQGSEHLLKLLNDILDITKIEVGQLALQPETVDLKEVIAEAVAMVRGMLHNKPVDIKIELSADLPALIADRLRVRQILLNLLSNAIKFTQAGIVRVRAWSDSKLVYVSVEDTGIGITPEKLPLVFEDYQQVSPDRDFQFERRRHVGTGLGLPITKALVELHGGHISVSSEPDQGTTFTVTLPLGINPARRTTANGRPKGAKVNGSY
jgi:signal transduction histidine kinase